jgi:dipeptidyl aminopeptidase/acylaminoacyl peptidase
MHKALKFVAVSALAALWPLSAPVSALAAPTPIPIDVLAHEPVIQQPILSDDGRYLAALTSGPGKPITISIWDTTDFTKPPRVLGMGDTAERAKVKFFSINWVSNDRLLVIAQQPINYGSGYESRNYTALARIVDVEGKEWIEPLRRQGTKSEIEAFFGKFLTISYVDSLPRDPDHVLVQYRDLRQGTSDIYKLNILNGSGERVARAGSNEGFLSVIDREGRVRVKQKVETRDGAKYFVHEIYDPASDRWEEHPALTFPLKQRRNLGISEFDPENPDLLLITDNDTGDLASLRGYDIRKKAFVETLFSHPKFNATGVRLTYKNNIPDKIIGFTYQGAAGQVYWLDEQRKQIYEALQAQFPGEYVQLGESARDGAIRIITVNSSRHPPSYYVLLDNRELKKLGDSRPGVDSSNLELTELTSYAARDGLEIPAFLTLPKGFRPGGAERLPAIVLPHGGPWARDDNDWDGSGWPQFLASRGYAVLQPQYRGSRGWTDKLWKAGDTEWGQKMQDDKDDGAKWLVDQGIAAPDRIAIFGYSYGGFAAMAAVVRPGGPYQCAIAGAGVSNLARLENTWGDSRVQREYQGWTVKGMDPMQNLDKASIPILVYSGNRDQRVPIFHSEEFVKGLQSRGKPVRYFEVEDMPHSLPWLPAWHTQTLTEIEKYLKTECGPGGL